MAVIITPVIGLILLWRRVNVAAAILVVIPMTVTLVISAYKHFMSSGPGNAFRFPTAERALFFRASAVLLVILEALGCGIGAWLSVATKRTSEGDRMVRNVAL